MTSPHPQFGAIYRNGAPVVTKIFLAPDVLLRSKTTVFVFLNAMFNATEDRTILLYKLILFSISLFELFSGNYVKNSTHTSS